MTYIAYCQFLGNYFKVRLNAKSVKSAENIIYKKSKQIQVLNVLQLKIN
jgi:hypothetical protein